MRRPNEAAALVDHAADDTTTTAVHNASPYGVKAAGGDTLKVTYDDSADAAYVQLVAEIGASGVASTYACDPAVVGGMINLDFDVAGRLVGIEVLDASKLLPLEVLALANE